MDRGIRVGVRLMAIACLAATLGCPGLGQRSTYELWIANQTAFAINQIVLTNHVTGQADNVITTPHSGANNYPAGAGGEQVRRRHQ